MVESLAFDSIVQAIVQLTDYLGSGAQIDRFMETVDLNILSEFYLIWQGMVEILESQDFPQKHRGYCRYS